MQQFTFIYALIDPRNDHVRYIGKSDNPYFRKEPHNKGKHYKQKNQSKQKRSTCLVCKGEYAIGVIARHHNEKCKKVSFEMIDISNNIKAA